MESNKPPYRFQASWKCRYHIKDKPYNLYYGAFSGNRPCWHILLDNNYVSELIPIDDNRDDIDKIYRVKSRGNNNLRFTQQKIRKIAMPVNEEHFFMSQEFVPSN